VSPVIRDGSGGGGLGARLTEVLAVIYLLRNEGYLSGGGPGP
jgi:hypothetical protein